MFILFHQISSLLNVYKKKVQRNPSTFAHSISNQKHHCASTWLLSWTQLRTYITTSTWPSCLPNLSYLATKFIRTSSTDINLIKFSSTQPRTYIPLCWSSSLLPLQTVQSQHFFRNSLLWDLLFLSVVVFNNLVL